MPFTLRDDQSPLVDRAVAAMDAGGQPCVVAPTGAGKTVMMAEVARREHAHGRRVVLIAHRDSICEQIVDSLWGHMGRDIDLELIRAGGRCRYNAAFTVGMVPTMDRRLDALEPLEGCTLIADECHHSGSASWERVRQALAPARRVGFTATPIRPNGQGLGDEGEFSELIIGPQPLELMNAGHLAKYRLFVPEHSINSNGLRKNAKGDYKTEDMENRLFEIRGEIVDDWMQYNPERLSTITVAPSVSTAHLVAEMYQDAGVRAMAIDGKMSAAHCAEIMRAFRSGELTVLVSCCKVDEGLDVPQATVLQNLRLIGSLRLLRQLCGRVLRSSPGKEFALIIDHTDTYQQLPLPHQPIRWQLRRGHQHATKPNEMKKDEETGELALVLPSPLEEAIAETGETMIEITLEAFRGLSPRRQESLLRARFQQELIAVEAGRIGSETVKRWAEPEMRVLLEPSQLKRLGIALGLGDRWAETQLNLQLFAPAWTKQMRRAAMGRR